MAHLEINGWAIGVVGEEVRPVRAGQVARTYQGGLTSDEQYRKRQWSFTTTILTLREAEDLLNLIIGAGWSWSFDSDIYSDGKGLSWSGTQSVAGPGAQGSGAVTANAGAITLAKAPGFGGAWTVALYRDESSTFVHYVIAYNPETAAREVWVDGTRNDAASTTWLTVSSSQFQLDADTYDEVYVLPYCVSRARAAAWPRTYQLASVPQFHLGGDFFFSASDSVITCEQAPGVEPTMARVHADGETKARVSFTVEDA